MSDPVVYRLKRPVALGSETVTEVTIGAIKGKHMRALPGNPSAFTMGTIMELAQRVTGQPSVLFDEMDSDDLMEVCAIVGERLGAGQQTGETA